MLKMSRKPSKKLAKLVLATLLFTGWAQLAISPAVVEAGSFASAPTITGTVVKDGGTPVTINSTNCASSTGVGDGAGNRAFIGSNTAFSLTPAEGYNVTITGANNWAEFNGVQLNYVGTIRNNILTINGGNFTYSVVGGQAYGMGGNNLVTQNTVIVNDGTIYRVSGGELSGYGAPGDAIDNTVYINGGQVEDVVYGGYAAVGNATKNKVEITGGMLKDDKSVYGGYSKTDAASGNEVSIDAAGKVVGNIYGGYTKNGIAGGTSADAGNKVILTNGTATRLHGGVSANGSASYNTVTMNGGTVRYAIYGGEADKGKAEYNEVVITKGDFSPGNSTFYIYGGSGTTDASNNTVTIKGDANLSEKTYIYGGSAMSITVSGTNVEEVLGIAANNTVNILKPITVLGLYGGIGDETKSSGNTLNIAAKGVVANDVAAFQNMNFYLPKDIANNDTMLTIKGNEGVEPTPANLKGVSFGVAALQGVNLQKGNTVNLVVGKNGLTTDDTLKTTDSASLGSAAFLAPNSLATDTKYELSISKKDANTIIATVDNVTNTDPTPDPEPTPSPDPTPTPDPEPNPTPTPDYSNNERLKSLVETRAGVVTMINAGADMLAGQGMSNAAEAAADTRAGGGFEAFGAVSGGKLRAESGSHVDTKGIGLNLGFARELSNKQGKLLFGPVIEYGHGSYDSYQDNGIKADGKTSYWGLGLIAKQTNHSGFYYEGSLRVGKTKSDYSSDLSPVNHANYDSKATYWAAHLGIGKMMDVGKDNTLDVYGKYFYSHTGSDNVTVHATSGDEEINFDAVNSHRLRIGTRLTHALNEKNKIYGGLAWQYEFKGDARATYNGGSTPSPSVKGSSGMIELGWQVKPGKSPMTIDLGVTGWIGKQRGITANLQANWTF